MLDFTVFPAMLIPPASLQIHPSRQSVEPSLPTPSELWWLRLLGGAPAGPAVPASSPLLCGGFIKAFKVEKRLISTSLPLGVGALIAREQKIKGNYSSGDTRQRDPGE